MTPAQRRWIFLAGMAGLAAFYLWGLAGLPGFGNYPGPYGVHHQPHRGGADQRHRRRVRGQLRVPRLRHRRRGVHPVRRRRRGQHRAAAPARRARAAAVDEAADRDVPPTSDAVRMAALVFTGPLVVMGWWLASHAQTSPSGGFQGGVILATAFILVYLAGEFLVFKRFSPVALTDAVEAVGAGGFVAVGLAAVADGPGLPDELPAEGRTSPAR